MRQRLGGAFVDESLDPIRTRLDRIASRIKRLEEKSRDTAKLADLHVREVNRIAPQLAALESKVEDLRQQLEMTPTVEDEGQVREARSLIDAIRREHEQIRIRLSAVTTYEERLRRIEDKLDLPHD